ncbi:MAG: PBECR4 domain-containing protein [Lachnospiraceae bacterium]|nr:PBECR4 domain-containing protein [Lachnospiraceae bacterium]
MQDIYKSVTAFQALLDTRYEIMIGRKGTAMWINISFDKRDCYHLMGLQYLTDIPKLRKDRKIIFDKIAAGEISQNQIEASSFYGKITDRILYLPVLEEMIDRNDTIFKYRKNANAYSKIEADFLLENEIMGRILYLFLSRSQGEDYFCRSFFPKLSMDYANNQASWTLLYKKKIKIASQEETVLYDRLSK